MDIETYRTQRRASERSSRLPNLAEETVESNLAATINAELLCPSSTLTITSDFLCPITQLIPEDAVIFADTFYERASAEQIIRGSLTKALPRLHRGARCIKNPINPSHVIYQCDSRTAITDNAQITTIINSLVKDVGDEWYSRLQSEVDHARSTVNVTSRGNDGKSIIALFTI